MFWWDFKALEYRQRAGGITPHLLSLFLSSRNKILWCNHHCSPNWIEIDIGHRTEHSLFIQQRLRFKAKILQEVPGDDIIFFVYLPCGSLIEYPHKPIDIEKPGSPHLDVSFNLSQFVGFKKFTVDIQWIPLCQWSQSRGYAIRRMSQHLKLWVPIESCEKGRIYVCEKLCIQTLPLCNFLEPCSGISFSTNHLTRSKNSSC